VQHCIRWGALTPQKGRFGVDRRTSSQNKELQIAVKPSVLCCHLENVDEQSNFFFTESLWFLFSFFVQFLWYNAMHRLRCNLWFELEKWEVYKVCEILKKTTRTHTVLLVVQLIRSKEAWKQIAVRFLQVNLFNDTVYRNAIELYNGEYFDYRQLIVTLTANSSLSEIRRRYRTEQMYDTMGIRITASPAFEDFGFIAEVVTYPLSPGWRQDYG